jgi:hypothetical protein
MPEFTQDWWFLSLLALVLLLLCFVAPPLLAARKGYSWYLWTIACGLLGLIVLAFLPYANKPDESEEVNRSRRQTGNIVGGVLSAMGLLGIVAQCALHSLSPLLRR